MALITIPQIEATGFRLKLTRQDVELVKMDFSQVIIAASGARWEASWPLRPYTEQEGREWYAALAQLSALENTFEFTPPDFDGTLSGYSGANPVVNSAQSGQSLDCDGVSSNTLIVRTGDYLEVQGEFKIVTADATSDGTGNVTINFYPPLRSSAPDNTVIELQSPKMTARLTDPLSEFSVRSPKLYDMTVTAVEAF